MSLIEWDTHHDDLADCETLSIGPHFEVKSGQGVAELDLNSKEGWSQTLSIPLGVEDNRP